MTHHKADKGSQCSHCGGKFRFLAEGDERGDRMARVCDRCGCQWVKGMILTHKGQHCPVHGEAAQRTALRRAVRLLAKHRDTQPTPA